MRLLLAALTAALCEGSLRFEPPVLVSRSAGEGCPGGPRCRATFLEAGSDLVVGFGADGRHLVTTFGGSGLSATTGVPLFLYSNSSGRRWEKVARHGIEAWLGFGGAIVPLDGGSLRNWGGLFAGGTAPPGTNKSARSVSAPTSTEDRVGPDGSLQLTTSRLPVSVNLGDCPSSFNVTYGLGNDFTGPEVLRLRDGSYIATLALVWAGSNKLSPHHYPQLSVAAFRSTDGRRWEYSSVVANASDFPWSVYGPQENDMALLADGKTIVCLLRMDGDGGCPYHDEPGLYKNYYEAFST
eukprot:COSAG04_NODE_1438_length_6767_cov_2.368026_1_plen_295_part_10